MKRLLALGLLLVSTSAFAQSLEPYGSVGGWDVMIDPSLGNGCLIQAAYQDGSVVRIGFDRTQGNGYVTVFNEGWGDIEDGKTYPVRFDLDGQSYNGEAKGIHLNGVPGADISFDSSDFLFDIAKKYTMTLYNDAGKIMAIDLGGTYAGLEAAMKCQGEQG